MEEKFLWITILATLLGLFSMGVFMFTITLILFLNSILSHAGAQLATIFGLIASLITLPAAFKIKSFYGKSQLKQHETYEIEHYHRYILTVSLICQLFPILICFISICLYKRADAALLKAITHYKNKDNLNSKIFVDYVQFLFQCCGRKSYEDWTDCASSVPYSCCKISILDVCRHENVGDFGTDTINTLGCGSKLTKFILHTLLAELFLYIIILILIIFLLRYLNVSIDHPEGKKGFKKRKWDSFVNSKPMKNLKVKGKESKLTLGLKADENKKMGIFTATISN